METLTSAVATGKCRKSNGLDEFAFLSFQLHPAPPTTRVFRCPNAEDTAEAVLGDWLLLLAADTALVCLQSAAPPLCLLAFPHLSPTCAASMRAFIS